MDARNPIMLYLNNFWTYLSQKNPLCGVYECLLTGRLAAYHIIKIRFSHFFYGIILVYPKKAVPLHRFSAEQGFEAPRRQTRQRRNAARVGKQTASIAQLVEH